MKRIEYFDNFKEVGGDFIIYCMALSFGNSYESYFEEN